MMSPKGASVVGGRGFGAAGSGVDPRSLSGFFSAIPPFPAALLGSCAEAEPSGATSATRYDGSKGVGIIPMVVPELEFVDVQRQVRSADLMETADDAALNQRPKAFDALSVDGTDHVLPLSVVDDFVRIFFAQPAIRRVLVCDQQADFFGYGLPNKCLQRLAIDAIDDLRRDLALAADRTNDRRFAGADTASTFTAPALAGMPVLREAANVGFVNFDLAEQLPLSAVLHCDAKAMAHVPSGFVGAGAEHAMDLKGAHAFLGVVHQERNLEPLDQRVFRVLEDGSGDNREPITVLVAAFAEPMERAGFDLPHFRTAAARAMHTFGPTPLGEEGFAVFLGLKSGDELGEGKARFHSADYMAPNRMVSRAG
jgi:hypothetical protein